MTDQVAVTVRDSERDLNRLVEFALDRARANGADEAEAALTRHTGFTVTARLRDIETLEHQNDRGFGVTVYFGGRKGSASTADFSLDALKRAVDKACVIARETAIDKYAGIARAEDMPATIPTVALDFPWSVSPDDARKMAIRCEGTALDADPRINNSEGASIGTGRSLRVFGNSHGFVASYWRSQHSLSCAVVAGDQGAMERDYHYSIARDANDLESPEAVGKTAAERCLKRLGSRKLSTRQASVIFPPELARGFMGHAAAAMSGGSQYRKASFLLGSVGEALFASFLQWDECPHMDKAIGSTPFDAEGVATSDRQLVVDGRFQSYILSSYSARRLGLTTTGNAGGLHNVIVSSSAGASPDLLGDMGEGLVLTELMGQGLNMVTGDYSRGAAGYWVEGGEIQYPVSEITIAGNLRDMYAALRGIGDDVDRRGLIQCGSLLIDGVTIAGEGSAA